MTEPTTAMTPWLLRPAEVADLLGVSRSKAYSLIRSGRIPSIRITGSVRVPLTELRLWIEANTVAAEAAP